MRKIYKISIGIGIAIVAIFLVYFGVGMYQQIQNEEENRFQDAVVSSELSDEQISEIISEYGDLDHCSVANYLTNALIKKINEKNDVIPREITAEHMELGQKTKYLEKYCGLRTTMP